MASNAQDAADRAQRTRNRNRAGAAFAAGAALAHTNATAGMLVKAELVTLVATAAIGTALVEFSSAPVEGVIIIAATAGTLAGAAVSSIMHANVSIATRGWRLVASFLAGLLLAPYAAAHIPRPEMLPMSVHVFSVSGLCAWGAWPALVVLRGKVSSIVSGVLDWALAKFGIKAEKDEHERGDQ